MQIALWKGHLDPFAAEGFQHREADAQVVQRDEDTETEHRLMEQAVQGVLDPGFDAAPLVEASGGAPRDAPRRAVTAS